jgi:hypothetical protein
MKRILLSIVVCGLAVAASADEAERLADLDKYWKEVVRCVESGDFAGYKATIHADGVLVVGISKRSLPLADALKNWEKEFALTKAGKSKTELSFRWKDRYGDATTAHETGMFRYAATTADGKPIEEYIDFEALLVKREGKWLIVMEYQKAKGTKEAWDKLKK